jgi:hypothetical protein
MPLCGLWLLAPLALVWAGCGSCGGNRSSQQKAQRTPIAGLGPKTLRLSAPSSGEHRIILDARTIAELRSSAERETPAFKTSLRLCDEAAKGNAPSGYQGFTWADAVAGLALCFHATGEPRYASAASRYLEALLDDRHTVGDKRGGADVVRHDSGYGIRTFGAYAALGYDWLRGTPGMNPTLRTRVLARLGEWLDWYSEHGYLRDRPLANYYWGYLTALSFAGLATSGEAPAGDRWLERARNELAEQAMPAIRDQLEGGGWPEGWQYGEYTALEVALVARGFRTGAQIDIASKLPWLGQIVPHHVHATLPDGQSVYDGGTWGEHPAKPSALALTGVAIALEGTDDRRAAEARWMIENAVPPLRREQAWAALLAERPSAARTEPKKPTPASLHGRGMGLTFARSDWSKSAVWMSFQAGPWLAEDHQDKDQGHFELWRGSDALLVDAGDSEGAATINHNTILVDDGGKHLVYAPNQGVWGGDRVKTTHFGDDGRVMVVVGDIGEAFAPKCALDGCRQRSVSKLVRSAVFVRPSLLVIHDLVEVDRDDIRVTWAAHLTTNPTLGAERASAAIGSSRVDIQFVEPRGATLASLREPTPSGDGPHRMNKTWGPTFRLEQNSPTGAKTRRFLAFISADARDANAPEVRNVTGAELAGATLRREGRGIAVLFSSGNAGSASVNGAELVVIAGLEPNKRYAASLDDKSCSLSLRPSDDANALVATSGGFVRIATERCKDG